MKLAARKCISEFPQTPHDFKPVHPQWIKWFECKQCTGCWWLLPAPHWSYLICASKTHVFPADWAPTADCQVFVLRLTPFSFTVENFPTEYLWWPYCPSLQKQSGLCRKFKSGRNVPEYQERARYCFDKTGTRQVGNTEGQFSVCASLQFTALL